VINEVRAAYLLRALRSEVRLERATRVLPSPNMEWVRPRYLLVALIVVAIASGANAAEKFTPAAGATRSARDAAILYKKNWENGLIDSGSWSHQAADTQAGIVNGIVYGKISTGSATADRGVRAGKFSLPANGSYRQGAMMLHGRAVMNGSDEWFAMAYYFPRGWRTALASPGGGKHSLNLGCPNYYSVNSCMVSVSARPKSMFTLINSGACPPSGVAPGCPWYSSTPDGGNYSKCRGFTRRRCGPFYIIGPGDLTLNVWHEIIMHVYYTLDRNGVVQFWHRIKGSSSWKRTVSVTGGFPTLQTGSTAFGKTVTKSNIDGWQSTDQFGLYRAPASKGITLWVDNWCRATSFASAARCFR
jgi:hypothetical protein